LANASGRNYSRNFVALLHHNISYFKDKGYDEVVFKAMGRAINKIVMAVELIKVLLMALVLTNITYHLILIVTVITVKRRIVDLHQNTTTGSTDITDMWEPLEEGLLP
jgi:DNA-binding protein